MMLAMSLVYFWTVLIKRVWVKGFDRKVKSNIIGAAALGISMIVDLIAYYKGMQQTDLIENWVFLYLLLCLVMRAYQKHMRRLKKVRRWISTKRWL